MHKRASICKLDVFFSLLRNVRETSPDTCAVFIRKSLFQPRARKRARLFTTSNFLIFGHFSLFLPPFLSLSLFLSFSPTFPPSLLLFLSLTHFSFLSFLFATSLPLSVSLLFFSFVLKISWLKTLPRKFCFFTKFTSY